ncbi:MAG: hypothetical protein DI629_20460 [Mesorhizobium amorphae]|nr:MAG: hypothetical protein DI629_20460 [Mesorhizobium amorphae]
MNLFPRLTSGRILAGVISFAPGAEMLDAITGVDDATTIAQYLALMRETGAYDGLIRKAAADLTERRDAGQLRAFDAEERFDYVEAWNAFVESDEPLSGDLARILCDPLIRAIEARVIALSTRTKNSVGRVRDHHAENRLDPETIASRLRGAEEDLMRDLREGDTTGLWLGSPTGRERPGQAHVMLSKGEPVVVTLRPGARHAWHAAPMEPRNAAVAEPDESPSP